MVLGNYMVFSICSCKHIIKVNSLILPASLQRAGEVVPLRFGCTLGQGYISSRPFFPVYGRAGKVTSLLQLKNPMSPQKQECEG